MNRIKSFTINHNLLMPGFYISREDGDVITYDLRTRKPNAGDYMDNATMHSLEHMFATYIRNSRMGNEVVYFDNRNIIGTTWCIGVRALSHIITVLAFTLIFAAHSVKIHTCVLVGVVTYGRTF